MSKSKGKLPRKTRFKDYPHTASQAKFLLGGIGTGNFSLSSAGMLCDFETAGEPAKGNKPQFSFFCMRVAQGDKVQMRVLEAQPPPPYTQCEGVQPSMGPAGPRMKGSTMRVRYPFVDIDFVDPNLPVKVHLQSFTPFIPLDADNSGIPGAVLRYTVKNISSQNVDVTLVGSMQNTQLGSLEKDGADLRSNRLVQENGLSAVILGTDIDKDAIQYGQAAMFCTHPNITAQPDWYEGGGWENIAYFWKDLEQDGLLDIHPVLSADHGQKQVSWLKVGSIGGVAVLPPGHTETFEFYYTWYHPNRKNCWFGNCDQTVKRYYTNQFSSAVDVGKTLHQNLPKLEKASRNFAKALYGSTLPTEVIECVANNITVLRSTTCFRLQDGTFLGWEGCKDNAGSCHGSCTHVWNYAQTLAFLFPELEKTTRRIEFLQETTDEGLMSFRNNSAFGSPGGGYPAVDGQMGTLIRLYREWKLTGDDPFLKQLWPNAKKAMDFAFSFWDKDGDLLLEVRRHNTYDIWFEGVDCLSNILFLGALKACHAMAEYLGDTKAVQKYATAFEACQAITEKTLWNPDFSYYTQRIDKVEETRSQFGDGCLSDMLFGQQLCHLVGLGYLLPKAHVQKAIHEVYQNNFLSDFSEHACLQRTYVYGDEQGLVLCTWPHGGRPTLPLIYSDEVWTGIEYQVATHLIYEGYVDEALSMVRAIRARQDGVRRSPFNEMECGNHYARSMASWGLLVALSGFKFDLCQGKISFAPAVYEEDFKCFFSCGKAWGIYSQKRSKKSGKWVKKLRILHGDKNAVTLAE